MIARLTNLVIAILIKELPTLERNSSWLCPVAWLLFTDYGSFFQRLCDRHHIFQRAGVEGLIQERWIDLFQEFRRP